MPGRFGICGRSGISPGSIKSGIPVARCMVLSFRQALYGVGIFLLLFGAIFAVMNLGVSGQGSFFDALAYGFTAAFFALFSGVLIGVGAAMLIVGMLLGLKGSVAHIAGAFGFSLLSLLIAFSAVAVPLDATFALLVVFFSGVAAAGVFLLSSALFEFHDVLRDCVYGRKKR